MRADTRRVAIVGGNRIPFARSNGAYAHASDQDMLTATLDGLVEQFGLEGETLGEVVAGAVLKHARDRNLTRECVLGSKLAPETPAYDLQQACGTGLETTIAVANKIALGQIEVGIAGGVDTASDAPIAVNEDLRAHPARPQPREVAAVAGAHADPAAAGAGRARGPAQRGAAHGPVDGRARGDDGARLGRSPARSRTSWPCASHRNLAAAYERGFFDGLVQPYLGLERDQNLRADTSLEKLAKLKPVFGGANGTMTAGNSTPLTDGASAVLLASRGVGGGARPAGARVPRRRADRGGRPRAQGRGPADGAGLRDAADARRATA